MSEESPDTETDTGDAPGASAGDAAPTQSIPHISKPAKTAPTKVSTRTSKKGTSPVTSTKQPGTADTDLIAGSDEAPTHTDKGRPRGSSGKSKPAAIDNVNGVEAKKQASSERNRLEPVIGSPGRPFTAADYAKTTNPSPSTTAVIPAVKDDLSEPSGPSTGGKSRQASLRLAHIEPWSVTRLAFAISVAMMVVSVVAVTVFWVVLDTIGVWDQINGSVTNVLSDESTPFNITDYLGFGRMVGLTLVVSAINVVLMTALATIAAHLYNRGAQLLGGIEVTFAEQK